MTRRHLAAMAAPLAMALGVTMPGTADAGAYNFVGEITVTGAYFCPRNTVEADGRLLNISQNTALFSLFGTMYGGDGRVTFALPDLQGRVPINTGTGPGLTPSSQGTKSGTESNTMTVAQLPAHNHLMRVNNNLGESDKARPATDFLGVPSHNDVGNAAPDINIYSNVPQTVPENKYLDPAAITNTGGNQPQNNMQPYQTLRYCVYLQGLFPSRN